MIFEFAEDVVSTSHEQMAPPSIEQIQKKHFSSIGFEISKFLFKAIQKVRQRNVPRQEQMMMLTRFCLALYLSH